ncbi:MAG: hypothetical protein LBN36_04270 [Clostridiales Family XIII bacterium]|nr:hypothetical protein [Clostridiales Family XIII bacterium]
MNKMSTKETEALKKEIRGAVRNQFGSDEDHCADSHYTGTPIKTALFSRKPEIDPLCDVNTISFTSFIKECSFMEYLGTYTYSPDENGGDRDTAIKQRLSECMTAGAELIIIPSISRMTRNEQLFTEYMQMLLTTDTLIYFAKENLFYDEFAQRVQALSQALKEHFKEERGLRIKLGMAYRKLHPRVEKSKQA